ncbi:hypothetical protein OM076_38795 [Solirubrobacter ginsenosidimutans]|uniref:Uncharacterized protein n=1 Tax=Solirubrobacter ginsenosidimutans TaxID=490573 RepID=A0A9X3N3A3_9ACTN|nr:hypothetical protein [Solirubrobacter ginsenosidimutans]MDA0166278.1 hypothetical protein [Solirubrobacter ginsenosidimutans]
MTVEDLRIVTPLGVWFWDSVTDAPVTDPLRVLAHPLDVPGEPAIATTTPSGVRAFTGLPGLHRIEYPAGTEDPLGAPATSGTFAVTVDDPSGRFLPATIELTAPHKGLAGLSNGRIYLFSAPTRRFAAAVAVARAQVAPHARVDVLAGGRRWAGIATEDGAVAIGFPYPAFSGTPSPSPPPGTGGTPPALQVWTLTVELRQDPGALVFPLPGRPPELASILGQPLVETFVAELHFGAELVLDTSP